MQANGFRFNPEIEVRDDPSTGDVLVEYTIDTRHELADDTPARDELAKISSEIAEAMSHMQELIAETSRLGFRMG